MTPTMRKTSKLRHGPVYIMGERKNGNTVSRPRLLGSSHRRFGTPAPWTALENVAVMEQTIKHCAGRGDIAEQLAPIFDRTVGSEQSAETLVTAHDDFQQILGSGMREFAHAEVVDDEQRHSGHPAWSPDGTALIFAGAPWVKNFRPHSSAIRQLDLKTGEVVTLPDSDGLWSPRWSPDGKFLVAETLDSQSLLTFEFKSRRWTQLAGVREQIGYTSWSSDSKFVYYTTDSKGASTIFRVSLNRRRPELIVSPTSLDEGPYLGRWFTLTPDDAPLLLRDTSIREIYSLTLQLP
jgi:hypothetical protein